MSDYLTLSMKKFVNYMTQERLSENTISIYSKVINKLSEIDTRIYRLSNEQIQSFILESESTSAQDLKINALKKFYKVNHPKKRIKVFIRPRKAKKIIEVLSTKEVGSLLDSIKHPKQKAIISGIYYHGLRISEILKLKYTDIDKDRNVLVIREGKGMKDGLAPLHEEWLKNLKVYSMSVGHKKGYDNYIFYPYSESSIRTLLKRHARKVGITKNVNPHLLRDCYASHLLEQGYDISYIQEILRHSDIRTTRKYVHISAINISRIKLKKAS